MLLRILFDRRLAALVIAGSLVLPIASVSAQEPKAPGAPPEQPVKAQPDPKTQEKAQPKKPGLDPNAITAENVVEAALLVNGGREVLNQIRRNGLERGKRFVAAPDGKMVESSYERRFKRGESSEKDQIRLDQLVPVPYGLVYANNESWGVLNNSPFSPRTEIIDEFQNRVWHSLDALFRYKEDGSTLNLVGKEKHGGVEVFVIDMAHKAKIKADSAAAPTEVNLNTRYFVSSKLLRVLWLEYDTSNVKYMRRFYDYKIAQGTFVPYRTVLFRDGQRIEETNILTVTYGIKMDDSLFAKSNI